MIEAFLMNELLNAFSRYQHRRHAFFLFQDEHIKKIGKFTLPAGRRIRATRDPCAVRGGVGREVAWTGGLRTWSRDLKLYGPA